MELNIRPMTPQEKIYAGLQSSQISEQTGFIGVLVGSFNQQDRDSVHEVEYTARTSDKGSILVGGAKRIKRTEEYHF